MTENAVEDEHGSEAYDPDLYVPTGEAEPVNGLEHVGDAEIERFKRAGASSPWRMPFSDAQMGRCHQSGGRSDRRQESGIQGRAVRTRRQGSTGGRFGWQATDIGAQAAAVGRLRCPPGFTGPGRAPAGRARVHDGRTSQALPPPRPCRNRPASAARNPGTRTTRTFDLPMDTEIISVWVALQEAHRDNGCMHVIPGSHLEGPVIHFSRRDWQICDTDVG